CAAAAAALGPAAGPEGDAFLPLAAELWGPVLACLLRDPEPFVQAAACDALAALCAAAGDFLAARLHSAWYDEGLGRWCRRARDAAAAATAATASSGGGLGRFAQAARAWE